MAIMYNPIIPKNFSSLLRSTEENGTHRFVVRGGRYSGKTTTVIEDALEGFITIRGANIVFARADDCDFRKTTFASVKKALHKFGIAEYCDIPKRVGDIVFRPNGNIIRFIATGGDEHRTKGLDFERGYVHRFIHDEAQELAEDFEVKGAEKTLLRLMGSTTKWLYIYNPPPSRGEFANVYFPAQVRAGRAVEIYSSWEDIYELLDKEVVDEILRDKAQDLNYYLYEYMGEITASRGLIYPQLRRDKHFVNIYTMIAHGDRVSELVLGVDEGTIYDSTCVTALAILYSGRAVVLDCFEKDPVETGGHAPTEQTRAIIEYRNRLLNAFPFLNTVPRRWIFDCAEAGQGLMLQMQTDTNYLEECLPMFQKSIMGDIKRVRSMLNDGILFFHVAENVNTITLVEDMEAYIGDEDTGKPKKGQRDDTIDSLEYATKLYYDRPFITQ